MRLRQIAKKLLPPIIVDALKWAMKSMRLQQYMHVGRVVPWSPGYGAYRERLIVQALADEMLLDRFRSGEPLPPGYGVGVDERCIEYPWLLAHLRDKPEILLDAGSALNHDFLLEHPVLQRKVIHILTLAPESRCFWQKGISYLYEDLRNIPIRDDYYDTIVCISTLEHVGLDNTLFIQSEAYAEQRPDDFLVALLEMRRVLKPGGRLFITVPYGKYRNFGSFQQFDAQLVERIIAAFESARVEQTHFRYTADGWNSSTPEACGDAEYVNWIMQPPSQRPANFPDHPDRAAAARALACLMLIKPG